MAVIAFVDGSSWSSTVIDYAVWAAKILDQSLAVVAREETSDPEPAIEYDAYQQMSVREDMFRELTSRSRSGLPQPDTGAIEIAQEAAQRARSLGIGRVRTVTTEDRIPYFVENSTDSGDLLVISRHGDAGSNPQSSLDQFLKVRSRTMLLTPEAFSPIETWMIAIDGKPAAGRAVDFLSRHPLLVEQRGTAVFVGNDYQNRLHFRDAVKHLESSGHQLQEYELQGSADDVLAAVLTVLPADMLVMGAYGQGRFRLLNERSTTSRLLQEFRGPVLIARA